MKDNVVYAGFDSTFLPYGPYRIQKLYKSGNNFHEYD